MIVIAIEVMIMSDRCSDNDDESDIDRDGGGDSDLDGDKRDVGIRSSHTKEEWWGGGGGGLKRFVHSAGPDLFR